MFDTTFVSLPLCVGKAIDYLLLFLFYLILLTTHFLGLRLLFRHELFVLCEIYVVIVP